MRYLLILLLCMSAAHAQDYRNRAMGFTNSSLLGYDAETNPNRTGIVSVSLDLNTAIFYLADPNENPALPHDVLLGKENHWCWQLADGQYRRREFNYVNANYIVDVVLNADNSLWVFLDDERIDYDEITSFCESS